MLRLHGFLVITLIPILYLRGIGELPVDHPVEWTDPLVVDSSTRICGPKTAIHNQNRACTRSGGSQRATIDVSIPPINVSCE